MQARKLIVAAGAASFAATASFGALMNGDIVFVNVTGDTVNVYRQATGMATTEHTVSDPMGLINLAQIRRVNGRFYVAADNTPVSDPAEAHIFEFKHLTGNTVQNSVWDSHPLQRPIGLDYHRKSDTLIALNQVPGAGSLPSNFDGIVGVKRDGSSAGMIFTEDVGSAARPRYAAGDRITKDPFDRDVFYATSINGGVGDDGTGPDTNRPSQIYRLTMDNSGAGVLDLLVDFSNTTPGPLTFVRGITSAVGGDGNVDLYVTDSFADAIFRVNLDSNGDFASVETVLSLEDPGEIQYNRYTNKLVFGQIQADVVAQINLDGSGYEVLVNGVSPRGITIIPAPGAAAALTLAGLAGLRRRR